MILRRVQVWAWAVLLCAVRAGAAEAPAQPPTDTPCDNPNELRDPCDPGEPVNVHTGNVWFDQTDVVIPGMSSGLLFRRSYNSHNAYQDVKGAFGRGWTHSYEQSLSRTTQHGVMLLRGPDGVAQYFEDVDGDRKFRATVPYTDATWIIRQPSGTFIQYFIGGGTQVFDKRGRWLSVTDAAGNTTTLDRNASGRLDGVTEAGTRRLTFAWEGDRIKTLSGPGGVIATYDYNDRRDLARVTYADGSGYEFIYDGLGQVVQVSDHSGRVIERHEYQGKMGITSELADGRERIRLSYGEKKTTVVDALGNVTEYEYAEAWGRRQNVRIRWKPCAGCPGEQEGVEWGYDANGRLARARDEAGGKTLYAYNAAGLLKAITDPAGQLTRFTYYADKRLATVKRPDGGLTTYTYVAAGPEAVRQSVSAATTRTASVTYNGRGRPERITDARGKASVLGYNSFGDLESVRDPLNHVTTFGYDELGRRTSVTDATNRTWRVEYDPRGRVRREVEPDGAGREYTYDLGGRLSTVTDALGRTTSYSYDRYGRLETVADAIGGVTTYGYDLMSRLTSLTDARGNVTAFEYDHRGRTVKVMYPGGGSETVEYALGRLARKTDRKGVATSYEYDLLGRPVRRSYTDGSGTELAEAVIYEYDMMGQMTGAANGMDSLSWTYDLLGRMLSESSARNNSEIVYRYDGAGNRLSATLKIGGVEVRQIGYEHDDASRLRSITASNKVFGFEWDDASRRKTMKYPNGIVTSYDYDDNARLRKIAAVLNGSPLQRTTYAHDDVGNRIRKTTLDGTEEYGYDGLLRLTGVSAGAQRWVFGYDAVGNRTLHQRGDQVLRGVYDESNRLLQKEAGGSLRVVGMLDEPGRVRVNGVDARMLPPNRFEADISVASGANVVTITAEDQSGNVRSRSYEINAGEARTSHDYDRNGNLVRKLDGGVEWTYEWTPDNRLAEVKKSEQSIARFMYDPLGRRLEVATEAATRSYLYDGHNILRETSISSDGAAECSYIHGPGIDEPLARVDGTGNWVHNHADGLGSIAATTDAAGTITSRRQYDAWGNIEAGSTEGGYAFTGREWDPETGLYYYRARYYDPKVGRFISEDPTGFAGGMNFYAYTLGNPIRFTDPTGLDTITIGGGVSGAVYGGGGAQAGVTIAVGEHAPQGWSFDIGLNGALEAQGGLALTASVGITWEFGNLGNSYEAANVSTPIGSCSVYRSGKGSPADAVFVGYGPGAGVTLANGETRSVYIMRDVVLPMLDATNRFFNGLYTSLGF